MPRKTGAPKPPKDLNAPKRPQSSYFLYASTRRGNLKQENPNLKVTEIAKRIAEEWKTLGEDAKKEFQDQADENKKKYEEELATYRKTDQYKQYQMRLAQHKADQKESKKGGKGPAPVKLPKRPKDDNAPKRPAAAYFVFQAERRGKVKEENPDFKIGDVAKQIGSEWQALSEDEKQPYVEKAADLKEQYNKDLEEYKKTDNYKQYQETIKKWKKECAEAKKAVKNNKKSKTKSKDESESESESGSESDNDNNNDNDSGSNSENSESESESSSESDSDSD